jgi:hypothetical protein
MARRRPGAQPDFGRRSWRGSVAGDRILTEEEFKVQVRQAIEAERAEAHAPPEADRPARK